jgi:DNA recombination protein RmuC
MTGGLAYAFVAAVTAFLVAALGALLFLKRELARRTEELDALRETKAEADRQLASANEALAQERKQAEQNLALLKEAREDMTREFKVLAEEIMSRHSESFSKHNREQVEGLLTPLREKLVEFQQGLQNAHTETAKDRAALGEQIRQLSERSLTMSEKTENLTRALKGKGAVQGAWGEMVLSTILEGSGLREGEEYARQESHTAEDGSRLRPDVVVNLPGGQRVVIDSKVSLTAFEDYVNGEAEARKASALKDHLASLKGHIRSLGAKAYHTAARSGLDYVIMFVPIEAALAAALEADRDLAAFAFENNVAIATPTTLMVALRTVASLWQVERRNRNAEEIAARAGRLYDKFVGFLGDMQILGKRLDNARESYDGAMGKLATGGGNIVRQVEQLKEMGAKATKSIPAQLIEDDPAESLPASELAAQ